MIGQVLIASKCFVRPIPIQRYSLHGIRQTLSKESSSTTGGSSRLILMQTQHRYKSSIPAGASLSRPVNAATTAKYTIHDEQQSAYMTGIVSALLAAMAGVLTVSGVANLVEYTTVSTIPKFDHHQQQQQRYDTTTYVGRFCHMLLQCDPYLLLYSNQQIIDAKHFVDSYIQEQLRRRQFHEQDEGGEEAFGDALVREDSGLYDSGTLTVTAAVSITTTIASEEQFDRQFHRQLWEMKRIYESAMNDSGAIIPRPFRMSGYVPYNGPICVAMVSSTTTTSLLFWSWINQSQNAFVNYYNRSNSSQPIEMSTFVQSYAIAVTSALCVAFGLATVIQKRFPPQRAQLLLRYVAFPSAVVASSLNCYIVRSPEIQTGIPLLDEDGKNVMEIAKTITRTAEAGVGTATDNNNDLSDGSSVSSLLLGNEDDQTSTTTMTSKIAATRGVYATTASRALLQAPVYFLPPVLISIFGSKHIQQSPNKLLPITTYLLLCSFGFGLPAACAIYPQTSTIRATQVEYPFQQLINPKTQQPYQIFYYDKGL